ncbi:MAG: peptidyl-prolyl cis-trans isomerase [Xanthomonadales bacterium]|nr:peptidyl-prolyl cis-trans isomerase [Xanthomonadales bacterium]
MLRSLALTLAFLPFSSFAQETTPSPAPAPAPAPTTEQPVAPTPRVALNTTLGRIVIELDPVKAPKSSENFLQYVRDGFYAGTVFHRVIPGFMAQGGGFTADLQLKPTRAAIPNEGNNGLSNLRGTVAMARTNDPHSATAQFFVNVVDNQRLDFVSEQDGLWGYAVFGKVVEGMEVIDKIIAIPTGGQGPLPRDVPLEPVLIESAEIVAEAPAAG